MNSWVGYSLSFSSPETQFRPRLPHLEGFNQGEVGDTSNLGV